MIEDNNQLENIIESYCFDIKNKKIKSNLYVELACKRHLNDKSKEDDRTFPYTFNPKLIDREGIEYYPAHRICKFAETFKHTKGKWIDKKIELEKWQIFILSMIFGWVRKDNKLRRFSIAYCEVPRKNGKSVLGAIIGNYMVSMDYEPGSEVYSGATTEKQAMEVFRPAYQMAEKSTIFREKFGISLSGTPRNPTSIYRLEDMSRFEPLVGNPGDGASPHCAIIDEYHEHKSSAQFDTMSTGMGSREQPLIFVITTAGSNTSLPCYDMHSKAIKVLDKSLNDETFFAIIFTIDQDANFKDFEVWKTVNPNYGISVNKDYLKRKYTETMTDASKQNINQCKHLNTWLNAGVAWMNMVKWAACEDKSLKLENFEGQMCYAALDLASKIDICALILLFERQIESEIQEDSEIEDEIKQAIMNREFIVFGKYYLPEETIHLAGNEHYVKWVKEGWITETPGARTDFAYIEEDLKEINKINPITELAFDPRESGYLINNIMTWIGQDVCVEINQGPALMSQPMKELEALVYSNQIWHNGDPVLNWMMGNVVKKQGRSTGPVKYYYPTKEKDENKIDGPVCLIMAISRAMLGGPVISVYEERGILIL